MQTSALFAEGYLLALTRKEGGRYRIRVSGRKGRKRGIIETGLFLRFDADRRLFLGSDRRYPPGDQMYLGKVPLL
jgi:hypothetical protein